MIIFSNIYTSFHACTQHKFSRPGFKRDTDSDDHSHDDLDKELFLTLLCLFASIAWEPHSSLRRCEGLEHIGELKAGGIDNKTVQEQQSLKIEKAQEQLVALLSQGTTASQVDMSTTSHSVETRNFTPADVAQSTQTDLKSSADPIPAKLSDGYVSIAESELAQGCATELLGRRVAEIRGIVEAVCKACEIPTPA